MKTVNVAFQRSDLLFEIHATPHVLDHARLMKLVALGGEWLISHWTDEIDPRVGHEDDYVIAARIANRRKDVTALITGTISEKRFAKIVERIPSATLRKIADAFQLSEDDKQNIINATL